MRILVISDIHGNLTALETVIEEAGEVDSVWCLGDLVGYGPDPNECIDRIRELPNLICLLGNHDAAAIGQLNVDTFNPEARYSIQWLQNVLRADNFDYLQERPQIYVDDLVTLVHGSPRSPVFEYLLDNQLATENFDHFSTSFCFFGHTHLPSQFHLAEANRLAKLIIPKPNTEFKLNSRTIINPGSVGQPRDRDPWASFAIFDSEAITWHYRRVRYDVAAVQDRMRQHELPDRHIQRLEIGW